jgi:GNAT superfamily N-acetyltransferase
MDKSMRNVNELSGQIKITPPIKGDIDFLISLYDQSIRGAFEADGYEDVAFDIAEELELKRGQLLDYFEKEESKRTYFIGKINGKIIGTINFGPLGKETKENVSKDFLSQGELGGLYILPEYQNKGYGSQLINFLVDWMKTENMAYFSLDSGYKSAQKKWLKKFGRPFKILNDYWDEGADHMIWLCEVKDFCK